jgi:hypothetical protein
MYGVFDSFGVLVRGYFTSEREGNNWIFANGNNPKWRVKQLW